ncbi:MAG: HDIG domain-containing protein [candidate division Zixibacteria bacterium]|nr:HDIG domain-containing protein [candidate division Zixibacteria bacterium]
MQGLSKKVVDEILKHGNLYEVGGCVRDSLLGMGIAEKDRDYLVTKVEFEKLVKLLKKHGHVDLVGKSFGVIKFTSSNNGSDHQVTYDIALPRSEFSTGVGHRDFQVDFDHTLPIEEDLKRRDFTINAIARNLRDNELVDPYGGREDLKHGLIRMLAPNTFEDDPLRMLRAVQFAARFEFEIEPQTFEAIRQNAGLISAVSPERIQEELNKLLTRAKKPSKGFILMEQTKLLQVILPELAVGVGVDQPGGYHAHDVFMHSLYTVDELPQDNLELRLAGLLHDIAKPQTKQMRNDKANFYGHDQQGAKMAVEFLQRLRYSNQVIKDVKVLIKEHMFTSEMSDKGLRRLIKRAGIDRIYDLLELRRADVRAQGMGNTTPEIDELEGRIRSELEEQVPLGVKQLAVDGGDIMKEFDIPPSPLVGEILSHLLEIVLDYPEKNNKEVLIQQARVFLKEKERE